ncbi:MAG: hypothetical protein H6714_02275 [Myxococcales bacterium]|nr:hypothetical protein [Myxococcales bacterium]
MKKWIGLGVLTLAACGSDVVSVNTEWFVRPPCASVQCPPPRAISAEIGDERYAVACELTGTGQTQALLLRAQKLNGLDVEYGIELSNGLIVNDEFVGGDGCVFKAIEGNTYQGACGSSAPSSSQPCQISDFKASGGSISLSILCKQLPLQAAPSEQTVSVTAPGGIGQPFSVKCSNL